MAGLAESVLWIILCVAMLPAQVLITGENGGKGSQAVMVSANAIQPEDFGTLANAWVQYAYGLTDRLDAFASYGAITVFGRSQHYAAIGSNIGLLRRSSAGLDVALYNNASIPFNHRQQASDVLLSSALIASRPVKVMGRTLTLYGGVSRQTPIGRAPDPHFTPLSAVHTGIAGVAVSLGKVTLYLEFNPAGIQQSGGIGVLYAIRPPAPPADEKTPAAPALDASAEKRSFR
jgi:hypothetical protein